MADINFPTTGLVANETIYTSGLRSWVWTGVYWRGTSVTQGYTGSIGVGYTGSASTAIGYTGSQGPAGGYTGSMGYVGSIGYVLKYTFDTGIYAAQESVFTGGTVSGIGGTGTFTAETSLNGGYWTHTWIAPADVTSVSVLCVGGGGGTVSSYNLGGGGGALAYINNYTVTPGNSYTVQVGRGGYTSYYQGGTSFFVSNSVVSAGGGAPYATSGFTNGGIVNAGTGFPGGNGGLPITGTYSGGGGGGAGGYTGNGGNGGGVTGSYPSSVTGYYGSAGAGGGGGGGAGGKWNGSNYGLGGGGGGVGLYGAGYNGSAGINSSNHGGGGGGGSNGYRGSTPTGTATFTGGTGGLYGGGSGGKVSSSGYYSGGNGAVRIIWPGTTRSFPSTLMSEVAIISSGQIKYNNSTIGSVTVIYLSTTLSVGGTNLSSYFSTWGSSTNTIKGQLVITDRSNGTFLNIFNVTSVSAPVISTDYYILNVTYLSGTLPSNGQELSINFVRAGDAGYTGSYANAPRVYNIVTTSSLYLDTANYDQFTISSLSNDLTISSTGTPEVGKKALIRITDNGIAQNLNYGSIREIGITLPTVTTPGKLMYIGLIYNPYQWDAVALSIQA